MTRDNSDLDAAPGTCPTQLTALTGKITASIRRHGPRHLNQEDIEDGPRYMRQEAVVEEDGPRSSAPQYSNDPRYLEPIADIEFRTNDGPLHYILKAPLPEVRWKVVPTDIAEEWYKLLEERVCILKGLHHSYYVQRMMTVVLQVGTCPSEIFVEGIGTRTGRFYSNRSNTTKSIGEKNE